jgi:FkbM family methyltransferase
MTTHRAMTALRHVDRAAEVLHCARTFQRWQLLTSAYIGIRSLPLPIDVEARDGLQLHLTEFYDLETLWQIYCRQVYGVRPGDRVIVDAGANIGLFTCFAAARAPRATIHAVEPFPDTYRRLLDVVRTNGLDARVVPHRVALSSEGGVRTMVASGTASQMAHLGLTGDVTSGVAVRTSTLTEFLESLQADSIDLLKMDIEGSEYEVLLSTPAATFARIRRINLEYHKPATGGVDPQMLVRHLIGAGFQLTDRPGAPRQYGLLHFVQ